MSQNIESIQDELSRRHRSATMVVLFFLALAVVLLVIAYVAAERIFRPADPKLAMGLWIVILICGLGVFVLRRTRFAAMRLKDIAAVKGTSAMLRTLQGTTIQVAAIAGAIALLGFIITIITGDWTNMLRAAGVSIIVLFYCYPFKSAWNRAVNELAPPD
jgi:VIT1/CCC1 family predicted Fe2+/Mn2+ transporter